MEVIILVGKILLVVLGLEAVLFGSALVFLTWVISKSQKGEENEITRFFETVEED